MAQQFINAIYTNVDTDNESTGYGPDDVIKWQYYNSLNQIVNGLSGEITIGDGYGDPLQPNGFQIDFVIDCEVANLCNGTIELINETIINGELVEVPGVQTGGPPILIRNNPSNAALPNPSGNLGAGEFFTPVIFTFDYTIPGCMDTAANNYVAEAESDDLSCEFNPYIENEQIYSNSFITNHPTTGEAIPPSITENGTYGFYIGGTTDLNPGTIPPYTTSNYNTTLSNYQWEITNNGGLTLNLSDSNLPTALIEVNDVAPGSSFQLSVSFDMTNSADNLTESYSFLQTIYVVDEDVYGCMDDGDNPSYPNRPEGYIGAACNFNEWATEENNTCNYGNFTDPAGDICCNGDEGTSGFNQNNLSLGANPAGNYNPQYIDDQKVPCCLDENDTTYCDENTQTILYCGNPNGDGCVDPYIDYIQNPTDLNTCFMGDAFNYDSLCDNTSLYFCIDDGTCEFNPVVNFGMNPEFGEIQEENIVTLTADVLPYPTSAEGYNVDYTDGTITSYSWSVVNGVTNENIVVTDSDSNVASFTAPIFEASGDFETVGGGFVNATLEVVSSTGYSDSTQIAIPIGDVDFTQEALQQYYIDGELDEWLIERYTTDGWDYLSDFYTTIVEGTFTADWCKDVSGGNYSCEDLNCVDIVLGCMDPNYCEFSDSVTQDNGTCATLIIQDDNRYWPDFDGDGFAYGRVHYFCPDDVPDSGFVNTCVNIDGDYCLDDPDPQCEDECDDSGAHSNGGDLTCIDDCGECSDLDSGHVWNSSQDLCGVCFGDNSTCSGCMDEGALNYNADWILDCSYHPDYLDETHEDTTSCCIFAADVCTCGDIDICDFANDSDCNYKSCMTQLDLADLCPGWTTENGALDGGIHQWCLDNEFTSRIYGCMNVADCGYNATANTSCLDPSSEFNIVVCTGDNQPPDIGCTAAGQEVEVGCTECSGTLREIDAHRWWPDYDGDGSAYGLVRYICSGEDTTGFVNECTDIVGNYCLDDVCPEDATADACNICGGEVVAGDDGGVTWCTENPGQYCCGCTNVGAVNFDVSASIDDGTCEFFENICTCASVPGTYQACVTDTDKADLCPTWTGIYDYCLTQELTPKVYGCINSDDCGYDVNANTECTDPSTQLNDGSECIPCTGVDRISDDNRYWPDMDSDGIAFGRVSYFCDGDDIPDDYINYCNDISGEYCLDDSYPAITCPSDELDCNGDCKPDIGVCIENPLTLGCADFDVCGLCCQGQSGNDCSYYVDETDFTGCYDCTGTEFGDTIFDCNNDCGGTAYTDECGNCVGGETGVEPCVQDCDGVYGGDAFLQIYYYDGDGDGNGCDGTGLELCSTDLITDTANCTGPGCYVSNNNDVDGACDCFSNTFDECGVCDGTGPQYSCCDGTAICDATDCTAICGCMDEFACNFNEFANVNNVTCLYPCITPGGCDAAFDDRYDCDGKCIAANGYDCSYDPTDELTWDDACGGEHIHQAYYYDADGDSSGGGEPSIFCTDSVPAGWVTNNDDDDDNCPSNQYDCNNDCIFNSNQVCDDVISNGVCSGDFIPMAEEDSCGVCSGGNTFHEADSDNDGCGCFQPAAQTYYEDLDGDGLGDPNSSEDYCLADLPSGWVLNNEDPDEICPSNQYDCNGDCILIGGQVCPEDLQDDGTCAIDTVDMAVVDECGECSLGNTGHVYNESDVGCGCDEDGPDIYCMDGDNDGLGDLQTATLYCTVVGGTTTENTNYDLVPDDDDNWIMNCEDVDDTCPVPLDSCGDCPGVNVDYANQRLDDCGICRDFECTEDVFPHPIANNPCPEGEYPTEDTNWNESCTGCTDPEALNTDTLATIPCFGDNDCCQYALLAEDIDYPILSVPEGFNYIGFPVAFPDTTFAFCADVSLSDFPGRDISLEQYGYSDYQFNSVTLCEESGCGDCRIDYPRIFNQSFVDASGNIIPVPYGIKFFIRFEGDVLSFSYISAQNGKYVGGGVDTFSEILKSLIGIKIEIPDTDIYIKWKLGL